MTTETAPKVVLKAARSSDCPICHGIIDVEDKITPVLPVGWSHLACPKKPRVRRTPRAPRGMLMRPLEHYTGETNGDR